MSHWIGARKKLKANGSFGDGERCDFSPRNSTMIRNKKARRYLSSMRKTQNLTIKHKKIMVIVAFFPSQLISIGQQLFRPPSELVARTESIQFTFSSLFHSELVVRASPVESASAGARPVRGQASNAKYGQQLSSAKVVSSRPPRKPVRQPMKPVRHSVLFGRASPDEVLSSLRDYGRSLIKVKGDISRADSIPARHCPGRQIVQLALQSSSLIQPVKFKIREYYCGPIDCCHLATSDVFLTCQRQNS